MIGNFEQCVVKKETTSGVTVIPNTFVQCEKIALQVKINKVEKEAITGNLLSPGELIKGKIEVAGSVDLFANKNDLFYMMGMTFPLASSTSNGDLTFTHTFDGQNTYGLDSFTIEQSKDGTTERMNGVRANGFNLTVADEIVKFSMDLIGMKGVRVAEVKGNTANSIIIDPDFAALFVTGDKIVENGDAQKTTPSNVATVASVNYRTGEITVGAGEGLYYTSGKAITLKKSVVAKNIAPTFRGMSGTKVTIDGVEVKVASLGINSTNANEGRFLTGSNAANKIRQGQRRQEITFEVDTEETATLDILKKYSSGTTAVIKTEITGDQVIGNGTRKAKLTLESTVSFTECTTDVAVNEFEIVNVTAIATAISKIELINDIASY